MVDCPAKASQQAKCCAIFETDFINSGPRSGQIAPGSRIFRGAKE